MMITKTVERPEPMASLPTMFATNEDVRRLLILREIEAAGALTGLEAVNAVASTAHLLGIRSPGYALLHDLTADGLLQYSAGMPRTYRLTFAGAGEAARLAQQCWPRLSAELVRLNMKFAPVSPRPWPATAFVAEWADESIG
jgi:hypothetical protein